ncbi:MAG: DEAD/DEAH box helicase [Hyphomicrobiaceae bacterium]
MQTPTFAELGLSAKVLAAIDAAGYPAPTPIQAQAIPVAVTGRDVLGIAQTGTGKTASFVLPMITRLETGRARARMPRSLILAPTRELAAQVAQSFEKYGTNHKLDLALLIGGVSMEDQVRKLDRGVDVLIATPGRLLDHFQRGKVMLMGVEILVIDEADRMLDMGFIPDIERICKLLPPRRQTLFFSATMPPEITRLVDQFLRDPARIEVARQATTAKTITQRFCFCDDPDDRAKRQVLRDLIASLDVRNAIIFCNRKKDVAILLKSLSKHGFNAGALHGDMDQASRTATLDKFRAGEITLLAASDVAARGLDIPDVSHVINYDVPWQAEDYVHRIGRTGRAGREGFAATIVTGDDIKAIEVIQKLIGEESQWIGEPPDEETLAEGRSRKRRGRGAPQRGSGPARGRREKPSSEPARARSGAAPGRERRESSRRIARDSEAPRPEVDEQPEVAADSAPARRQPTRRRRPDGPAPASAGEQREAREQPAHSHRDREPAREPARAARGGGGRDRQRPARDDRADKEERTPQAFGDHMPAFLRRPVRVSAD